jgi:hypothetical protein
VTVVTRILWAPRSRQIPAGQNAVGGPASAQSAVIELRGLTGGDPLFTQTVTRQVPAAGGPQDYSSPRQVAPGLYFLTVRFYAGETPRDAELVGQAAASANVLSSGGISTTIATTGTITTVEVPAGQVIPIGTTQPIVYTAKNAEGIVIALPVGAAFVELITAQSALDAAQPSASVNGDLITGIAPSQATVRVRVDNAVSANAVVGIRSNTAVSVAPNPATVSILQSQQFTASITGDPTNSGVTWSIVSGTGATIDPNTGIFTTTRAEGNFVVRATSKYDPGVFADVAVTVRSLVTVTLVPSRPNPVSIGGETVRFTAVVNPVPMGEDRGVVYGLEGTQGLGAGQVGTITPEGVYTSPATEGDYVVTARSIFDDRVVGRYTVQVRSGSQTVIVN